MFATVQELAQATSALDTYLAAADVSMFPQANALTRSVFFVSCQPLSPHKALFLFEQYADSWVMGSACT